MSRITGNWLIAKFNDGTRGNLTVEGTITAAGGIAVTGSVSINGAISATGNITAPNLSYVGHTHAAENIISGTLAWERLPAATVLTPGAVSIVTTAALPGNQGSESKPPTVAAAYAIADERIEAIPKADGTGTFGLVRLAAGSGLNLTAGNIGVNAGNGIEISGGAVKVKTAAGLGVNSGGVYLDAAGASSVLSLGSAANKDAGSAPGNVPILGADGKIDPSQISSSVIHDIFYAASDAEMTALSAAQKNDQCIRTDKDITYYLASDEPGGYAILSNWKPYPVPVDSVLSVNGKQGTVLLIITDLYAEGTQKFTGVNAAASGETWRLPTYTLLTEYAAQKVHTHTTDAITDAVASGTGIEADATGAATAGAVYEFVSGGFAEKVHTHTSDAVTDAATDASGISATAEELTQARAVFDFIDKTVQREALTPITGNTIPITRSGENFSLDASGPVTLTLDTSGIDIGEGEAVSFRLFVIVTGNGAVTLPAFNWAGEAPEINVPGTYIIDAITVDQGWSWGARAEYYTYPDNPLLHRALPLPSATGGAATVAVEDGFLEYHLPIGAASGDGDGNLAIEVDTDALAFDATDEQRRGFFAEIFLEVEAGNYTPPAITWTGIDRWADFCHLRPRLQPGKTYVIQVFSLDAGQTICAAATDER